MSKKSKTEGKTKNNQDSYNFLIFEINIIQSGARITVSIKKFINEKPNEHNKSGVVHAEYGQLTRKMNGHSLKKEKNWLT